MPQGPLIQLLETTRFKKTPQPAPTVSAYPQGIAISMINSMGKIRDPEDGKALQNFLICIEMLIAGALTLIGWNAVAQPRVS